MREVRLPVLAEVAAARGVGVGGAERLEKELSGGAVRRVVDGRVAAARQRWEGVA